MTEPDQQPEPERETEQPPDDNAQVWKTTIHAEAEVIPGEPKGE